MASLHRALLLAALAGAALVARAQDPPGLVRERAADLHVERMAFPKAAERAERALRAVPGLLEARLDPQTRRMRVRWDPARVEVDALLAALEREGFAYPSLAGPIVHVADLPAVRIEAFARPGDADGADAHFPGQLEVVLRPKPGWRLGGEGQEATTIAAISSTLDAVGESTARFRDPIEGERSATFGYSGREGHHDAALRVRFQARRGDGPSEPPTTVRLPLPAPMGPCRNNPDYSDH